MHHSVYKARRELFESQHIPLTRADLQILRWKQRVRLFLWERTLQSLLLSKRMMDVILSVAALLVLAPCFLIVAVCILMDDGFPVLHAQKRVGLYGREFVMYKFRSMIRGADALCIQTRSATPHSPVPAKDPNDPRITRVGHVLRRFSIDEWPQFFNVLRGDLSIVGPRPPLPSEVASYSLAERKRLHVRPGLTCLWQIQGRADLSFDEQVDLDMLYIRSQSIASDMIIILKTIPAVLFGRGAY